MILLYALSSFFKETRTHRNSDTVFPMYTRQARRRQKATNANHELTTLTDFFIITYTITYTLKMQVVHGLHEIGRDVKKFIHSLTHHRLRYDAAQKDGWFPATFSMAVFGHFFLKFPPIDDDRVQERESISD